MAKFFFVWTLFVLALPRFSGDAHAGWIKDRIRSRLEKKLNDDGPLLLSIVTKDGLQGGTLYTFRITPGDTPRYYQLYVPKGYEPGQKMPLVLALHGGGGDMSIQSTERFYHFPSVADKNRFLVAFPNGTSAFSSGKLATWNAGTCCGRARDQGADDVAFLASVVEDVKTLAKVDETRIFATGMSNGAMMSYQLACHSPPWLRAIAPVAGTDNSLKCEHPAPIPVFHLHARDDEQVPFSGGKGKFSVGEKQVAVFRSVPATVEKWVAANGCDAAKGTEEKGDGFSCTTYSACSSGKAVKLCVTDSGGHSWPGGKKPRGGKGSTAYSATEKIWEFFSSL